MKQLCPLALVVLLFAGPSRAETLQARVSTAGWRATTTTAGEHCVTDGEGQRRLCWPALPGALLTDLVETPEGWLAAGHSSVDGRHDLFLMSSDGESLEPLPTPAADQAPRGRPQLARDATGLQGIVWLEGGRQETLELRAAEWLDGAWALATTVSPTGVGSQLAPTVTVLDDSRWLVLWTAHDGADDETLWSTWNGRRWSIPERLHEDNKTPDVTPTVLAIGRGALAAWSWLDGRDYRLRLASFDGSSWRLAPARRERGVVSPRLVDSDGEALLTFSSVIPEAWTALLLDADGRLLRSASVPSAETTEPLAKADAARVSLEWPSDIQFGTWRDPQ